MVCVKPSAFVDGSDDEASFRSDGESDYADMDEPIAQEDEAAVTSEYAKLQEVEAEMMLAHFEQDFIRFHSFAFSLSLSLWAQLDSCKDFLGEW